jgi:hypothetical protein
MDQYINVLHQIVAAGQKTNSYKFALWRAIARLAPLTDEIHPTISKHDLSPLFLEYYWPLEVRYHLRQGIDPDKDPIVMKLIRNLLKLKTVAHGETLQDFRKRLSKDYNVLVTKVAKDAFDDVIPRFHQVRGAAITPKIFSYAGKIGRVADVIELTAGSRHFLIEYKKLIDYVAVSGWVRFTEQFTSAPRLHDKIDGTNLRRGAISMWRTTLSAIQNGRCFYDDSHEMTSAEVDHVLPWSFVLEDRTWNLVLACRKCNNQKRDRLTDLPILEKLCSRNQQIRDDKIKVGSAFGRNFDEWRSRDLSAYIKGLYDQATADGFPKWK